MRLALYRIYQLLIMAPVLIVVTALTSVLTILGSLLGAGRWVGYYFPMVWARAFCLFSLVRVKVTGRGNIDKKQSYVFVANHQGAYDIFSLFGYIGHQFRWMMKKSLEKIPLVGYACKSSGQIFVDNSSPSAIRETMARAERQLRGGMSLIVFPEGARSWDGNMRPFKRGAYKLAAEFGLPMVPITIDGAFDVLPRYKKIPHWGTIKITIHPPIDPPADEAGLTQVMERTQQAIASVLPAKPKGGRR